MKELFELREAFLRHGTVSCRIRPVVLESWKRCRHFGLNPEIIKPQALDTQRLKKARAAIHSLFLVAETELHRLHLEFAHQPHIIALSDSTGSILQLWTNPEGDTDSLQLFAGPNLFEGASWREHDIGSNGIGTCLAVEKPVLLIGAEHYHNACLGWTSIGLPLRSPEGVIVSALSLAVPNEHVQAEKWGSLLTLAKEIERRMAAPHSRTVTPSPSDESESSNALNGITELLLNQINLPETYVRIIEDAGQALGSVLTKPEQTDEKLRSKLRLMETITNRAAEALFLMAPDGRVTFMNPAAEEMFGWSRNEMLGKVLHDIIHYQHADGSPFPMSTCPLGCVMSSGKGVHGHEDIFFARGGRPVAVRCSNAPVFEDEKLTGAVLVVSDITDAKRAEEALRESGERLQAALIGSGAGTFRWNIKTNGLELDNNLERLFGLPTSLKPRKLQDFFSILHPEDRPKVIDQCERCARHGAHFDMEYRVVWPDGAIHWIYDKGKTFLDELGNPSYMAGACVDITERKRTELELAEAQIHLKTHAEELERIVADRTAKLTETIQELEILSHSIVHDMRSPLRAMNGYAQLILEDHGRCLEQEPREYLQRIIAAAVRQDQFIQDVISYTQIYRQHFQLRGVDLDALLSEILRQYPDLKDRSSYIEVAVPLGKVRGHEALLTQCISNLLGNALKFVSQAETSRVKVWTERVEEGTVRLNIHDNGIGIAPEYQRRIFEMFYRLHPHNQYPGTGIGLAIVKKAVERMGGKIGVESELGAGSRFWIELPDPKSN